MKADKTSFRLGYAISLIAIAMLFITGSATAQTEKFLHSFNTTNDGSEPNAGLVFDATGNLYGTTQVGGTAGIGTVFQLIPRTGGGWTERVIHNFTNGVDANSPQDNLIIDSAGNLYGTGLGGGLYQFGAVFELSPSGHGWTEKVLHSFQGNGIDGNDPFGPLTLDAAGNLYGTTERGGTSNDGTVFELSPTSSGPWTETILFSFVGSNGANPLGGVVFDSSGNLYSTTQMGGAFGYGCVFELSPSSSGWTETVLYSFNNNNVDTIFPYAGVVMDSAGNLYGMGEAGTEFGGGAVFELSPSGGTWTESLLHTFLYNSKNLDGIHPEDGLTIDAAGNLYGTTRWGGSGKDTEGDGTVFKLSFSGGTWTEKILHNFNSGTDGKQPVGGVILDASGNIYGTTQEGGTFGNGTVFEIIP
jgi:uncharacterized repeat protein (TIGR03803 family)